MIALLAQAWQSWKTAKSLALLVVVALAVGIGSATAIFTAIDGLLFKPLPYAHGERFVSVLGASPNDPDGMSSLAIKDVLQYQQRARSFDLFGWFRFSNLNLTAPGQPQYLEAVEVTPALANGIQTQPEIGQWFRDAASPAAVISHGLWQRLGGEPSIVGKTITLNRHVFTVAGVMPRGFHLPLPGVYSETPTDVWLPLDPSGRGQEGSSSLFAYARLRPGLTAAQADSEIKQIAAEIARREPATHHNYSARVDDLRKLTTKDIRPVLLLVFLAAEALLLITCANVGGLLVARAVARARDTAVRIALGARWPQLALQYFLEGLFVSVPGAVGALLLNAALTDAVVGFAASSVARVEGIGTDWRVVTFALLSAVAAGALTSVAPLWQAARTMPNEVLSEGVRASAGARSRRVSQGLVITEIALAFVLLALGSVLAEELWRLARVWPGFDPEHLLTFQISMASESLPGKPARVAYEDRLVDSLRAIPGVTGVAFVNQLPLNGCCLTAAIYPERIPPPFDATVSFLSASPDYWSTMRIPLRRGRLLDRRDTGEAPLAAVIDERAAARFWPGRDPIGWIGHFGNEHGDPFQVVGIVADVKNNGLDNPTKPEIYIPAAVVGVNPAYFVVRSNLPLNALVPDIRRAIQQVNPGQPIHAVQPMTAVVNASVAVKRISFYLMTFFALAALLMVTVGVYGVVSYSVRQRTVEIGTRMALGAVGRDVLSLVVGSGLKMAGVGIAIGGFAAAGATWALVRNFEIAIGNEGTGRIQAPGFLPFLIPTVIIAAVAVGSSFFPAWWATLLSPMVAIRNQPEAPWRSARERLSVLWDTFRPAVEAEIATPPEIGVSAELAEASQQAGSFREALQVALESVRAAAGADSALLFENAAGAFRAGELSIPLEGLLAGRLRRLTGVLPVTPEDLDVWRKWAVENRPERLAEIETISRSRARFIVGLRVRENIVGLLCLGVSENPKAARLLQAAAAQFALMLENARLTDRIVQQEKLRRDVELAAEVQQRLLAARALERGGVSLAAVNVPARSVGGDYYDFLDLSEDRIGIALADVAGKGVAAALIMAVVQASLRVIASDPDIELPQLAARMNHFLYRSTGSSSYATFFYAQLNERARELRFVNAGHNPPFLLCVHNGSASVEELTTGGMIIGMFPQARYEEGSIELHPGDLLAVFTDGVTEAQNPAEEEFGEERLKTLLRSMAHLPVQEIADALSAELRSWIREAPQYDDLTFVLVKLK